ncbi:MAG: hypothetical protein R2854_07765 [Caldilineaceae bacterium]
MRATPRYDAAQPDLTDAPLVFTPENWATPQALTVRAQDDQIDEQPRGRLHHPYFPHRLQR